MRQNVIVKKSYRGIPVGTEFGYNEKLDSWVFEKSDEDINDNSIVSQRSRIQFSNTFVESNPDIFEIPKEELITVEENERIAIDVMEFDDIVKQFKKLEKQVQTQLKRLKKIK